MDQPVRSSTHSLSTINEMVQIPPPLFPSIETQQDEQTTIKPINRRKILPLRMYPSKKQPDVAQKNGHTLSKSSCDLKEHIVTFTSSETEANDTSVIRESVADNRLKKIIHNLSGNPSEEERYKNQKLSSNGYIKWIRQSRRFLRNLMEKSKFHYTVIAVIIIDLIVVFIELTITHLSVSCLTDYEMEQYNTTKQQEECLLPPTDQLETGELVLYYVSLVILGVFVVEFVISFYAFGWRRYTKILYFVDALIIFVSFILEIYFHFVSSNKAGRASAGLVILRLWKIIRAIHAVAHSISLRNNMMIQQIKKTRTILKKENLQAEMIIREHQIQIDNLTKLLRQNDTHSTTNEKHQLNQSRTTNFDSVTFF